MSRAVDPFGTCQKCGARILWIRTQSGKNMPVNPELIDYVIPQGRKGKERIVTPNGEVVAAERASGQGQGFGYISHFATCAGYKKKDLAEDKG